MNTHPAILELSDALEVSHAAAERTDRAWDAALEAFPDDHELAQLTGRDEWKVRFLRMMHDRYPGVLLEQEAE